MNPSDLPTLRARLSELADAVGSKAPGEAGLKAWLAALSDFAMPDVVDALDIWLRTKPKMPTPAEIRGVLASRLSDRIEHHAVAERDAYAAGAKRIMSEASSRIARDNLDKIARMLRSTHPEDPDDWWHRIIGRWRLGESLEYAQIVNAKLAWERAGKPSEWTPPDAEAQLERAAIQAEGSW